MTKLMVAFFNSWNAPNKKMTQNYITNEILYLNVIFVVLFHKSVYVMYQHYKTNVVYNCLQFIYNNFTSLNGSLFLPVYPVTSRKKYLNLPQTTGNCTHSTDYYYPKHYSSPKPIPYMLIKHNGHKQKDTDYQR